MTFTITYNDRLVTSAAARIWWLRIGITYVLAIVFMAVCVATLVILRDTSWWTGALATVLFFGLAVPVAGFIVQRRSSLKKSRALSSGQAEISLSPQGLRFSAVSGAVEYPWSKLRHLRRYPQYWLVGPSRIELFVLSLDGFPDDARDYMAQQIRERGGTVA